MGNILFKEGVLEYLKLHARWPPLEKGNTTSERCETAAWHAEIICSRFLLFCVMGLKIVIDGEIDPLGESHWGQT